jgi:hypothetical protein
MATGKSPSWIRIRIWEQKFWIQIRQKVQDPDPAKMSGSDWTLIRPDPDPQHCLTVVHTIQYFIE